MSTPTIAHTSGPWLIQKRKSSGINVYGGHNAAERIAIVDGWISEEEEANARLIAAAPDLLAALKGVVRLSDRKHEAWDRARAAIAKAEGQA